MTSSHWRLGITIAFLGFASMLPATVRAQPPVYLAQWGVHGSGDGQFIYPTGVATGADGSVYVVDYGNQRIQKFSSNGTYLTQWGSSGNGDGQFNSPFGIATDAAGNVYVTELDNRRIQKFTGAGAYLTQWGAPPDSSHDLFLAPYAVATDAAGDVYVVDYGNHCIKKFTGAGTPLIQWGSFGSGDGEFNYPIGVATDAAGNVYVVEFGNHRVQKFTSTGIYLTQWGSYGGGDGQFASPAGVATDDAGNVYVADFGNHRIQEFTGEGAYITQWGSFGNGDGQFSTPRGVATDAAGNVYVADQGNDRIQKFGPASPPIAMAFDFMPNDLHLNSRGTWVTGYLRPPAPYLASQIDVASIRLNGLVPVSTEYPAKLENHDTRLKVKFLRAEVKLTLAAGNPVPLMVTGMISDRPFTGTDSIKVKAPKMHAPKAGAVLAAGNPILVSWDLSDAPAPAVTLLSSWDDGVTWNIEAREIANTGSYEWTVPAVSTAQGRLAIVEVYDTDETGVVSQSELVESDAFSIAAATDVEDVNAAFALRPSNPAIGPLTVRFSLASGARATLAVYDVGGREVVSRAVGSGGPGWQTIQLGEYRQLPAGVYVVRLTQNGRSLIARAAVLR